MQNSNADTGLDALREDHSLTNEREKALREILEVISASRDEEKPVFDAILTNAVRLCETQHATLFLVTDDRAKIEQVATRDWNPKLTDIWQREPRRLDDTESSFYQVVSTKRPVHIHDLRDTPRYQNQTSEIRKVAVDSENMRTLLHVPLLLGDVCIGVLMVYRREVRPFSDDHIILLETFAAQAVIAIENVRQFREVQIRLERETASRQVLDVISRSRDDDHPVFEVLLKNALRLCRSEHAALLLLSEDGERLEYARAQGGSQDEIEWMRNNPTPLSDVESSYVQALTRGEPVQIEDLTTTKRYHQLPNGARRARADRSGARTVIQVPLISRGQSIGLLSIFRTEVRLFTSDEVSLVETFAAQAVIAIENVRQFREIQARTEEVQALNTSLEERVKEQIGEIERMGRLKRFLPAAVADQVVSQGAEKKLSSHRALLGVLFCDIRGFTAFCETAEPEETIEILQTYHEEMGKLINTHGAGVDHRMGDGIMVLFNDPLPCEDPAGNAVKLAIAMRARMSDLCRSWKRMGYRLGFGVGISLGYATVGMVGFEGRSDYTASGTAINLASRLCDEAADGEILLSTRAAIAVEDVFSTVSVGEVSLKGIREPVEVFRLDSV